MVIMTLEHDGQESERALSCSLPSPSVTDVADLPWHRLLVTPHKLLDLGHHEHSLRVDRSWQVGGNPFTLKASEAVFVSVET